MRELISGGNSDLSQFLTAALTFTIGVFGGYFAARLRVSEQEFYRFQLRKVRSASFKKQKLMNFSEYRVFRAIERDTKIRQAGFRLVAQPSLGEILKSPRSKRAFDAINSKRTDILIIDKGGWPVLAIEYQGEGHYDGTALLRDDIKRTALQKAGIGYLEIFPDYDDGKIVSLVREQLRRNITASRRWSVPEGVQEPRVESAADSPV